MELKALEWRQYRDTIYEASNYGDIRNAKTNRVLKPYCHKDSYKMVNIGKQETVHSIVAECFMGQRPLKYTVNHIDGDKLNNNIENLEYVTYSENTKHAFKNGLANSKNVALANRKLTPKEVEEIRNRYIPYCRTNGTAALGKEFGVHQVTISQIVRKTRRVKYETA